MVDQSKKKSRHSCFLITPNRNVHSSDEYSFASRTLFSGRQSQQQAEEKGLDIDMSQYYGEQQWPGAGAGGQPDWNHQTPPPPPPPARSGELQMIQELGVRVD